MMIISRWTDIGPEWKTEDIFRIREIFLENHIPFRMPFSDDGVSESLFSEWDLKY